MLRIRPDFNSSSIVIRKSLLSAYHENYDFNVRPDSFIFTLALMSTMDLMLDNKVLTHYRIYGGNVSTSYNATTTRLMETFMDASITVPMNREVTNMIIISGIYAIT